MAPSTARRLALALARLSLAVTAVIIVAGQTTRAKYAYDQQDQPGSNVGFEEAECTFPVDQQVAWYDDLNSGPDCSNNSAEIICTQVDGGDYVLNFGLIPVPGDETHAFYGCFCCKDNRPGG